MGGHGLTGPSLALAQHQHQGQSRGTGADVHHQATGEVDGAELEDPALDAPHPVAYRGVDQQNPHRHEHRPRRELEAVGDGSGDQRRGDHREGEPECGEGPGFPARHVFQEGGVEAADERPAPGALTTEQRGHHRHPEQGHDAQAVDVHHQHVEHVLGAHHAAVEQGQARGHEQHERCRCEHPGHVTAFHGSPLPRLSDTGTDRCRGGSADAVIDATDRRHGDVKVFPRRHLTVSIP